MPGQAPQFSSSHSVKRYRPQSTLPTSSYRLLPTSSQGHLTTNIFNSSAPAYNNTAVPYSHDKRMVSQIQASLIRAANVPRGHNTAYSSAGVNHPTYHPAYPPTPSSAHHNLSNTITYYDDFNLNYNQPSFGAGGNVATSYNDYNHPPSSSQSNAPKAKNLQYNTPIGLYSRDKIREELNRQVG